jgi:ferredoxin
MVIRRVIQVLATLLTNAYWLFPFTGGAMYAGRLKSVCTPGLNCYSCPAAVAACPLGAIQNSMANLRINLDAGNAFFGLYVIGFLGMIGSLVGRMPCGWLCPFGFFQELVHKIPSPSFEIPRPLTYVKYVLLGLFVILLPLFAVDEFGFGQTWFCKFVCPAGTLEAGLPMLGLKPHLKGMIGWVFYNKLAILVVFLVLMVFVSRPFCRVACPLGAIYALFNKTSAFRMVWNEDNCTHCMACYRDCPMGVKFYENANYHDCIRCLKCYRESCKFGAISYELSGLPAVESVKPKKARKGGVPPRDGARS